MPMRADVVLGTIFMREEYRHIVFLFDFGTFEWGVAIVFRWGTLSQFRTVTVAVTLAPVESRRAVLFQLVTLVGADVVLGAIRVWEIDLVVGVVHFRAGLRLRNRYWGCGVCGRWRG